MSAGRGSGSACGSGAGRDVDDEKMAGAWAGTGYVGHWSLVRGVWVVASRCMRHLKQWLSSRPYVPIYVIALVLLVINIALIVWVVRSREPEYVPIPTTIPFYEVYNL